MIDQEYDEIGIVNRLTQRAQAEIPVLPGQDVRTDIRVDSIQLADLRIRQRTDNPQRRAFADVGNIGFERQPKACNSRRLTGAPVK
jgi:hypothetical protein